MKQIIRSSTNSGRAPILKNESTLNGGTDWGILSVCDTDKDSVTSSITTDLADEDSSLEELVKQRHPNHPSHPNNNNDHQHCTMMSESCALGPDTNAVEDSTSSFDPWGSISLLIDEAAKLRSRCISPKGTSPRGGGGAKVFAAVSSLDGGGKMLPHVPWGFFSSSTTTNDTTTHQSMMTSNSCHGVTRNKSNQEGTAMRGMMEDESLKKNNQMFHSRMISSPMNPSSPLKKKKIRVKVKVSSKSGLGEQEAAAAAVNVDGNNNKNNLSNKDNKGTSKKRRIKKKKKSSSINETNPSSKNNKSNKLLSLSPTKIVKPKIVVSSSSPTAANRQGEKAAGDRDGISHGREECVDDDSSKSLNELVREFLLIESSNRKSRTSLIIDDLLQDQQQQQDNYNKCMESINNMNYRTTTTLPCGTTTRRGGGLAGWNTTTTTATITATGWVAVNPPTQASVVVGRKPVIDFTPQRPRRKLSFSPQRYYQQEQQQEQEQKTPTACNRGRCRRSSRDIDPSIPKKPVRQASVYHDNNNTVTTTKNTTIVFSSPAACEEEEVKTKVTEEEAPHPTPDSLGASSSTSSSFTTWTTSSATSSSSSSGEHGDDGGVGVQSTFSDASLSISTLFDMIVTKTKSDDENEKKNHDKIVGRNESSTSTDDMHLVVLRKIWNQEQHHHTAATTIDPIDKSLHN